MAVAVNLLLGLFGFILAIIAGEVIYRRRRSAADFFGNLSQLGWALVNLLVVGALILLGGGFRIVALVWLAFSFALARTRWDDVRSTNLRRMIMGDWS